MDNSKVPKVYKVLLTLLLLQFLFFPKIWMWEKVIILALALIYAVSYRKCILIFNGDFKVILIYVIWNIISMIRGIICGYSKIAVRQATVDILWPFCYLLLMCLPIGNCEIKQLQKIIIKSTFVLAVFDIFLVISTILDFETVVDFFNFFNLNPIVVQTASIEHINIRIDHQYLYAFLTPFCIISAFEFIKKGKANELSSEINKLFVIITSIIACVVSILTGIGGIWLAVFSSLLLYFILYKPKRLNINIFISIALIIPVMILILLVFQNIRMQLGLIMEEVKDRLLLHGTNAGDFTRHNQAVAMIQSWLENPIIGKGTGVPIAYERSTGFEVRVHNELSYLIILYQRGLIGLILFTMIVCKSYIRLSKMDSIRKFAVPFSIGMISFLIPNAFNPYLANISTMWILFLPFLIRDENNSLLSDRRLLS